MLWKLLREAGELSPPTHLAVIFDLSEHTFRNELYADYKAHRPDMPEDLVPQFPLIRDAVRAFNVPASNSKATRPTTSSPPMRARRLKQAPT